MTRLEQTIHEVLGDPGPDRTSGLRLLSLAASLYSGAMTARADLYKKGLFRTTRLKVPVVSIGNLTAGGTGKTPAVMEVARIIRDMGLSPAVLSRGHGGNRQKTGALVSDGGFVRLTPREAGDEPCLMALRLPGVPLAVGRDRAASGESCIASFRSDVLLLDDGYQYLSLCRDIDILLADSANPFGNGRTLPRGPLREPVSQIRRADALVLTRAAPSDPAPRLWPRDRPLFRARHRPIGLLAHGCFKTPGPVSGRTNMIPASFIAGKRIAAFSGIAGNSGFFDTLSELGAKLVLREGFSDHHPYTPKDIESIFVSALRARADIVVSTEKDAVRLGEMPPEGPPFLALAVEFSFYEPELFAKWLETSLLPLTGKPK
jgi:tetraacyldisaccharide 4'-kinase